MREGCVAGRNRAHPFTPTRYLHQRGVKRYFLYGMPLPQHGNHHANLSVHSDTDTQNRDQLPCVEHFHYFRPL